MNDRVPVTLLTGFLGSGKTTLLRELLRSPAMSDAAVIVNEFGAVGLDHLLIERGSEDVVLLDSGCLCCAVSNGLAETLEDLHYRRLRHATPRFSRVVIETSGLAEPAPIMHLLLADPAIVRWYELDGVVATVDGVLGARQLAAHPTCRKQVAVADAIVLTKADVSDSQDLSRVRQMLEGINSRATLLHAAQGHVDSDRLMGLGRHDAKMMARWLRAEGAAGGPEHSHASDIATYSVVFREPLQWSEYADWIASLQRLPADQLLRVKGVIGLGDKGLPHVVQGVQHVFGHPVAMDAWPWSDRHSRIVFIVQELSRAAVTEALGHKLQAVVEHAEQS